MAKIKGNEAFKLLMVLVIILIGFKSCLNSSPKGYSGGSMARTAVAIEKEELAQLKINRREEFDKMYSDGLNLEDVTDIREDFEKNIMST